MKKSFITIFCILGCISVYGQNASTDSLLKLARENIAIMKFSKALQQLNFQEKSDSLDREMLYLKAEIYLISGNEKYITYVKNLIRVGADEQKSLLKLKHSLFIGSNAYDSLHDEFESKYPRNSELIYCEWLNRLDSGDFEYCQKTASSVSKKSLFSFAPYLALYYHAWDRDHQLALHYLDTLENMVGKFHQSKYREILKLLAHQTPSSPNQDVIELPFSWCGSGMGFYLLDEKGDSVKIEIDTGTGYGLMTIHDLLKGKSIAGEDVMVVKNGIQYNYMDSPRDLYYKTANLSQPGYHNFLFGYFDGQFSKADGCASPFAFRDYALQIDPVNKQVFLRSHKNIDQYITQNRDKIELIPYQLRNGWMYIPCKVNGKEVMMMMETGSREVNFNKFSAQALGLESYQSTIQWRGKDFQVEKVDCIIEIGKITDTIKGGFITDFVLGNWYYGLGSAGDIGPDFLKKYVFTIDPFHDQIIFELPKKSVGKKS